MDESDREQSELRKKIGLTQAKYQESLRLNQSLESELRAAEDALADLRQKLRSANRKRGEASHYRSLLHQLRSRWYLRPFIPAHQLLAPNDSADDCWKFRGPRFARSADAPAHGRRRVLIVGHLLSSLLFGSENSLLDLIAAIDSSRFDVFVVFPERNDSVFAQLQRQVQGIAVLDYAWWRIGRPAPEESVAAFEALLAQLAIDLVHVNTIMIQDPLVAARRLGIPAIVHARELISLDDELVSRIGGKPGAIVKAVRENATYILANSSTTLAEFECGDRGSFVYNSVDEGSFDFPNSVDPECVKVGMISSNIRKKGLLEFFELASLAEESHPTLQFHLIGPLTPFLEEWRSGYERLPANLYFRNYVSPPADAYRDLNIVLNLSRFAESFGRTVAEAMMARRPVIAYRHGALPELIVAGETGFLVPYLDLSAVLDRLSFFVSNPAKVIEFGEAARQRSLQLFSRDVFEREINSLYERLIANARETK